MSKKTKLGSWFTDPMKRSWVNENDSTNEESDFDWVKNVSTSVPSWDDREKIDLVDFLLEISEYSESTLEYLNDLGVLEPADDYRMRYTDEEWDEYGFDRWRDADWLSDGMVNTQLDRDALIFSHDIIDTLEVLDHPKWEFVNWDTRKYDLEKSTHSDVIIVKNKKQDRYFAIYLEGSPWDGVNFDEDSLVEVFPKKITKTIYESKITNKIIVENDFEWASEFNWSKEMLDDMLSDCKTLRVANFNVSTKEPYFSAGGPSIMFLSRCKEWWDYFGGLPLTDSGRGPAEWFDEVTYDSGDYGVIWNPSWGRKKITPQLEDLKDEYTSAITTGWGYGIEKQLNGISNSEAWFVVDENNKPIYNLIPNTVKEYAEIYEKEFFGGELNESGDWDWTKASEINFFDDNFEKDNFYSDQSDGGPTTQQTRQSNLIYDEDDSVYVFLDDDTFADILPDQEDYVLEHLLKYSNYDDQGYAHDSEEINYQGENILSNDDRMIHLLDDFISEDELRTLVQDYQFIKLGERIDCPLFSNIFENFVDEFIKDYDYIAAEVKSEGITNTYQQMYRNLDFSFDYSRLHNRWEIIFNKDDFWSYFAQYDNHTVTDYIEDKFEPLTKENWVEKYHSGYHPNSEQIWHEAEKKHETA